MLAVTGVILIAFFFSPQRVTMRFMGRLAGGHIWSAQRMTLERNFGLDRRARALYRPIFGSIRFGVSYVERSGSVARVGVAVQMTDMVYVMNEVSAEVTRIMLSTGPRQTRQELFYTTLRHRLREPDLPTLNFSATAQLVRVRGWWRIDMRGSRGLADAITGGMGGILGYESHTLLLR